MNGIKKWKFYFNKLNQPQKGLNFGHMVDQQE
jgi:hypothetical protein